MIALIEEITTEKALIAIEKDASLYDGMFVDMKDDKERKFVKDKASVIGSLLKKLDRARIDKSANFKIEVEEEALKIKGRLEKANEPFTALIDKYKEVRRVELEQEKELQAAKDLAFQTPLDHEEAISMNKLFDFEKAEIVREQKERDQLLTKEANDRALQAEKDKAEAVKQAAIDAENAEIQRLADVKKAEEDATASQVEQQKAKELAEKQRIKKLEDDKKHVGKICGEAKLDLIEILGVEEKLAVSIVMAITKKLISNLSINY